MREQDLESLLDQMQAAGIDAGAFKGIAQEAGGIHAAWRLRFEQADFFLKTTRLEDAGLFEEEIHALGILRESGTVLVPRPLLNGIAGDVAYLLISWIDLSALDGRAAGRLGRLLAMMHRCTADRHGWKRDNHIGLIRQKNDWNGNWVEFYAENRLRVQLELARHRVPAAWQDDGMRLLERLPQLLAGHEPEPSLLHGDLWNGNAAMRPDGEPVIYDPACYYGDREADLAMTELFGALPMPFYVEYQKEWPLPEGYEARKPLYQLYHVINHANMFGGAYAAQAERLIARLLAQA